MYQSFLFNGTAHAAAVGPASMLDEGCNAGWSLQSFSQTAEQDQSLSFALLAMSVFIIIISFQWPAAQQKLQHKEIMISRSKQKQSFIRQGPSIFSSSSSSFPHWQCV